VATDAPVVQAELRLAVEWCPRTPGRALLGWAEDGTHSYLCGRTPAADKGHQL